MRDVPFPLSRSAATAVIAIAAIVPATVSAQSPVSVAGEVNVLSGYLFAGIPFADGAVSQARLTASAAGFTFNAFSVWDYELGGITEVDVYGDYYVQVSPVLGLFLGGALYSFDFVTSWESTPEVYGGIAVTAPLNPTLYAAHDFDLGDGTHVALTLSEDIVLGTSGLSLDLTGSVDYNHDYYVDFSGFAYADAEVSVGIPVGPLRLSPLVVVQFVLDRDFQAETGFDDVEEVFGIAASMTF